MAMSNESEDFTPFEEFKHGLYIVIYNLLSARAVLFTRRVRSLLIGIAITLFVVYTITIPIRLILFALQSLSTLCGLSQVAAVFYTTRRSITFWNVLSDSFWYIPLLILFFARTFSLFPGDPFDERLLLKNKAFALQLVTADDKQTWWTSTAYLLYKFVKLLSLTTLLYAVRLIPGLRIVVALAMMVRPLYRRFFQVNKYINNRTLSMLVLAVTILFSARLATLLMYCSELYLTQQTLSREFLSPYFMKVTPEMEQMDKRNYVWLLFGFGLAMTVCFALPISGLILYPVFQQSAADVLVFMVNRNNLSFVTHHHLLNVSQ